MLQPVVCKNDIIYCYMYIGMKTFAIKFKDNESIKIIRASHGLSTKKNYNFNYEEEEITINNNQFIIIYGKNNMIIIDKNSRRLLVSIRMNNTSINTDIFKFFNQSLYECYKYNSKWLTNNQEPFPTELIPTITKCQILLSLSSSAII